MIRLDKATPQDGQRVRVRLYGDREFRIATYYVAVTGYPDAVWYEGGDAGEYDAYAGDEWEPL